MRKIILTLAVLLSLGGVLNAQYLDYMGIPTDKKLNKIENHEKSANLYSDYVIVNSFPSPVQNGTDIAFDGTLIWVAGYSEYYIYGLNPENGVVKDSIAIDILRPYGLTYSNGFFWIVDHDNFKIEKIDARTGEVLENIDLIFNENTYPIGVVVVNDIFYLNDPRTCYQGTSDDYTRQLDGYGTIINNYYAKGEYPTAICFDGQYLWSSDNVLQEIHQIDMQTFETVKTISAPGGIYPNGLCFDGQYLWVQNNDADSIYQLSIPETYTNITDIYNDNSFSINPNIVKTSTTIDCSNYINKEIKITLINQSGQVVSHIFNGELNTNTINYYVDNNLSNGLYFCRISTRNNIETKKIIIQR